MQLNITLNSWINKVLSIILFFILPCSIFAQTHIEHSQYIGGNNSDFVVNSVKDGNFIYVLGVTYSSTFPSTDGSVYNTGGGAFAQDLTLTKINASDGSIIYNKIIGGNNQDTPQGVVGF